MTNEIILWAVSLVVTALITALVTERVKRRINKNELDKLALTEAEKEKRDNALRDKILAEVKATIKEEVVPIADRVVAIEKCNEKQSIALQSTLRNDIHNKCSEGFEKGSISANDLEAVLHMFEAYQDLGGNSFIADEVARYRELPIK